MSPRAYSLKAMDLIRPDDEPPAPPYRIQACMPFVRMRGLDCPHEIDFSQSYALITATRELVCMRCAYQLED